MTTSKCMNAPRMDCTPTQIPGSACIACSVTDEAAIAVDNGTTERQMRNQYRAWARYMAAEP